LLLLLLLLLLAPLIRLPPRATITRPTWTIRSPCSNATICGTAPLFEPRPLARRRRGSKEEPGSRPGTAAKEEEAAASAAVDIKAAAEAATCAGG
jgi:hypothetical protein